MTITLEEAIESANRNVRVAMELRAERDILRKQLDRYTVDLYAIRVRTDSGTLVVHPTDVEFITQCSSR